MSYSASTYSNALGLEFKYITRNYFAGGAAIHVYLTMGTEKYDNLLTSSGGTNITGVAVGSTIGGTAYIIGDDYENLADTDTIMVVAKYAATGYRFVGWYDSSNMTKCLSTDMTATFAKSQVYKRQLIAVFEPVAGSSDVNGDTGNV